jgi:hypothetical protein
VAAEGADQAVGFGLPQSDRRLVAAEGADQAVGFGLPQSDLVALIGAVWTSWCTAVR